MAELSVESVLDAIENARSDVAYGLLRKEIRVRADRLACWAANDSALRLDLHAAEGRHKVEELDVLTRAYERHLHEPAAEAVDELERGAA